MDRVPKEWKRRSEKTMKTDDKVKTMTGTFAPCCGARRERALLTRHRCD